MAAFKFEDYRQPWETGPHWELKKEFMDEYMSMFSEDRLLCLAQAYANVVLMNCSYPDPVMQQISHLAKPLKLRRKFQGDDDICKNSEASEQKPRGNEKQLYTKFGKSFKEIKFCSSEVKNEPSESLNESKISPETSTSDHILIKKDITQSHSLDNKRGATEVFDDDIQNKKIKILNEQAEEDCKTKLIRDNLGIELIQKMAQKMRTLQAKKLGVNEVLLGAVQSVKVDKLLDIDIYQVKNTKNPRFCCDIKLKNCLISSMIETSKRMSKYRAIEEAINKITEIASNSIKSRDAISDSTGDILKTNDISAQSEPIPQEIYTVLKKVINEWEESKKRDQLQVIKAIVMRSNLEKDFVFQRQMVEVSGRKPLHEFSIIYKGIQISCTKGPVLKRVRRIALSAAYDILQKLNFCVISGGKLVVTNQPKISYVLKTGEPKPLSAFNKTLFDASVRDNFVLINNFNSLNRSYKTVVQESASFCKKSFKYEFETVSGTNEKKAFMLIDEKIVGYGIGHNKDEAKTKACINATDALRKIYYTLQITPETEDCFKISREYAYSAHKKDDAITETNIGCQMLKRMGWSGGGLGGIGSEGVAEPVGLDMQHNYKQGLGYAGPTENLKEFRRTLTPILNDLKKSDSLADLVFSRDFTKDERKIIHDLAARIGLNTVSRGKGDKRFMVVRRKYNLEELLYHLGKVGGYDEKFQFIDASIDEYNPFKVDHD